MQQITPFIIINFYKAHIAILPHKGIFYWLPKIKWILGANTGFTEVFREYNKIIYYTIKLKKIQKYFSKG